ncbi:alkaline phosphatase D family protein [Ostreibacterium oceani]|uniref:Alkaline phosphatase n=1 Tax=Ostreibacterium oceani TaxID=2654998 RepID=A0A6N7EZ93_9GAMM|nr:alkaline phosphatase D family protein [Ostreibacterium oceani]MPV85818.1 alkaline phosphatase [Ostreibacterium oceani]
MKINLKQQHLVRLFIPIGLCILTPSYAQNAPNIEHGIQFGDLQHDSVMVWSRSDSPAKMMIEYADNKEFTNATLVSGPFALSKNDFTTKKEISDLPLGKKVYVKVWYEGLTNDRAKSNVVTGEFDTLDDQTNIRFVWGGDTAGQGYGINEEFGGMKIYDAMRRTEPHFFIHSGDIIYADGPIALEKEAEEGKTWTNLVAHGVDKVAESLDEFRGRYQYNLMDKNVQAFNAEVPQIWQWDDHEVVNNWSDAKDLSNDTRYQVKDVPLLTARAAAAFHEYSPKRPNSSGEPSRVYRKISYGPLLDVFVIDMRSYRGPNTNNLQKTSSPETALLGQKQLSWLSDSLNNSDAVWKVIASDMPIGLNVSDDYDNNPPQRWEAVANNNDGVALGRELEFEKLFSELKNNQVENVVWLTADVHYAAAHYYEPMKAASKNFNGFWEFVAGPLNAGSFGPNSKDATFGIQTIFEKAPPKGQSNLSPYAGLQFFGEVNIDNKSKTMTVNLKDLNGEMVFSQDIPAKL